MSEYFNRDDSWIQFHNRLIEEASDPTVPPLEREKFWKIAKEALDDFWQVKFGIIEKAEGVKYANKIHAKLAKQLRKLNSINLPTSAEIAQTPKGNRLDPKFKPRKWKKIHYFKHLDKKGPLLVHHPYQSFDSVISFLEQAVEDPKVTEIKQTLYRVAKNSQIVRLLCRAAKKGKSVTVLVETRARGDELSNTNVVAKLLKRGVNILECSDIKVHAKILEVVRGNNVFYHISSGNYNEETARIYSDLSLFWKASENKDLFKKTVDSKPSNLRSRFIDQIQDVINADPLSEREINLKINNLEDQLLIDKLYEAAEAGVKIRLLVRGICTLKPRKNIEVRSIVDRFLEHSRIYIFKANGMERALLGSADWMERSMDRRSELVIDSPEGLSKKLIDIFETGWKDNVKARVLQSNGLYKKDSDWEGQSQFRSQEILIKTYKEKK